ncbi:hypothetical protein FAM09_23155 [Niastella caeni]|uniref:Uncharacterized protein n=1 Tax=Niastella caeni TaxID=2569763 RepID=A0A4S8HM80_9BACT|nr:hypothetical protein [Niastella caeni]THU34894.1 hypothetical protein FAM09_23155 [Niastella caeni]
MIRSLRKRHLQIWTALAVLLPLGIIVAWMAIPKYPMQTLLQPDAEKPLPEILKQRTKDNYIVFIRSNRQRSAFQLEWLNKKPLTWPTATIYKVQKGSTINNGILIGRIESRGTYRFALDSTFQIANFSKDQLILYDFIHQQIIDTINF